MREKKKREKCGNLFAIFAKLVKLFGLELLPFGNDVHEVVRQNERRPLTPDAELFLKVAQDVAKVDVEQLPIRLDLQN